MIKECQIRYVRETKLCKDSDCSKCGWNPEVAKKRKKDKIKKHKNGLWGF